MYGVISKFSGNGGCYDRKQDARDRKDFEVGVVVCNGTCTYIGGTGN